MIQEGREKEEMMVLIRPRSGTSHSLTSLSLPGGPWGVDTHRHLKATRSPALTLLLATFNKAAEQRWDWRVDLADVIMQMFVYSLSLTCSHFHSLSLALTDKSFPRAVVKPESQVVLKNEEVVFHCQFTAVPEPTLEWYHENELLVNKSRYVSS